MYFEKEENNTWQFKPNIYFIYSISFFLPIEKNIQQKDSN